jgi:hypothetical protein
MKLLETDSIRTFEWYQTIGLVSEAMIIMVKNPPNKTVGFFYSHPRKGVYGKNCYAEYMGHYFQIPQKLNNSLNFMWNRSFPLKLYFGSDSTFQYEN